MVIELRGVQFISEIILVTVEPRYNDPRCNDAPGITMISIYTLSGSW